MTATTPPTPAGTTSERVHVLVVDDDPVAREVVLGHLAPHRIEAQAVASAEEALALIEAGTIPDVVVSDLMMPGMHGFEFCYRIRSIPSARHLPVLCVSAAGDRGNRLRALEAGADDLLAKPVDDVELLARIRSMDRLRRLRVDDAWRRQLDGVIDAVGEGIVVTSREGVLVRSNASGRRLLGLPEDAAAGFDIHGFVRRTLDGPDLAEAGPILDMSTYRDRAVDRHLDIATVEVEVPGADVTRVLAMRDATDRVRAARLSDLVLSSVGHKLRTPLTGLASTLELIDRHDLPADLSSLVQVAHRSASRLRDALLRILDAAAAIEAGTGTVLVDLPGGATAETLARVLDVDLSGVDTAVTVTAPIRVDAGALAAAITEYLDNARARSTVRPSLHLRADDDGLELTVEDHGPGFPSGLEELVFTPFLQSDLTGQDDGMGLGLSLVRHLVEAAGGTVSARSRGDGPTRFTATLPVGKVA